MPMPLCRGRQVPTAPVGLKHGGWTQLRGEVLGSLTRPRGLTLQLNRQHDHRHSSLQAWPRRWAWEAGAGAQRAQDGLPGTRPIRMGSTSRQQGGLGSRLE